MDDISYWEPDGSPDSGAARADWSASDRVTVLRTFGPLATKRVIRNDAGEIEFVDYDKARYFRFTEHGVFDLLSLAALLDTISSCKQSLVVRGQPLSGINRERATRTLRDQIDPETGEVLETATLESVPRHWLLLDIDGVPCPEGMNIFDADVVVPYISSLLPAQFYGVSCPGHLLRAMGLRQGSECGWPTGRPGR